MYKSNIHKIFGIELQSIVNPLLDDFGASDRDRLEHLLTLSINEQIRLSDGIAVTFPDLDPAKALKAFTNLRSRFNQLAEEKEVKLRLEADSHKRDAPIDRFCWFEGPDLTEILVAPLSEHTKIGDRRNDSRSSLIGTNFQPLLPEDTPSFQRTRGISTTLAGLITLDGRKPGPDQARDALQELEAWAIDPNGLPFFALLGENGIGKTTTLKEFTRHILTRLRENPAANHSFPLPIYIDLRDYVGETKERVPTIEELLDEVIRRAWKLTDRIVTPSDILRLVREEGALIIFDGLDEKIVQLTPEKARAFIRTLWSILPDLDRHAPAGASEKGHGGKMILSCRSHYFRDVMSQNAMLVGSAREGIHPKSYPALCLLPFSEEQIRGYLTSCLGNQDRARAAFELIARVHNLPQLAERPYLLSLIADRLEDLESLSVRGETVNAARLYDLFVRSWLIRDDTKHQIEATHKRQFTEDLAAGMWRSKISQLTSEELYNEFDIYLSKQSNTAIARAYSHFPRAALKADLMTATFMLRPSTEEKHFRFAHSSLQEFFLASYLARALREARPKRWRMPLPSDETLNFLGQILAWDQSSSDLEALGSVFGIGGAAAVAAFGYWLLAIQRNLPTPQPLHVNLAGEDLSDWTIRGTSFDQPLVLRGANLAGTRVSRARLEHVDLTGANLTGLIAHQALFLDVRAPGARAAGADLGAMRWRTGSLARADLTGATLGCQWIGVDLTRAILPPEWSKKAIAVNPRHHRPSLHAKLVTSVGHASDVKVLAVSQCGRWFASGSSDNTIKLWDVSTAESILIFAGHTKYVTSVSWSPDGCLIVSGSDDKTLRVWDTATGKCVRTLEGHTGRVLAVGWSPDGWRIVSGSDDNTIRLWDPDTAKHVCTLKGHRERVEAVGWSPDSRLIVSGSYDKTLMIWDAEIHTCIRTLKGHTRGVQAVEWSPDGRRIVSGSHDDTLKVWDADTDDCIWTLSGHSSGVLGVGWSMDSQRIASGSCDMTIKIWDTDDVSYVRTLKGHDCNVQSIIWSVDNNQIISGSSDATLKVWDTKTAQCVYTLSGDCNSVRAVVWSPDGRLIVSGSDDNTLKVWDTDTGKCVRILNTDRLRGVAWSPDGRLIISGSDDNTLKVWDTDTGKCVRILKGHTERVWGVAWSPDGQRIVSGSNDKALKAWDANNGECIATLEGHGGGGLAVGWSPDGRRILSGSDDQTVKVWDADTGDCIHTLKGHSDRVGAVGWSPDGWLIVSGSGDKTLKVWNDVTTACVSTLQGHNGSVQALCWSPDSRRIVSGSNDNTIKMWDADTGECARTLQGHTNVVQSVGWSPDGRRIVSGADDNTMKMWDAETGACLWTWYLLPEGQTACLDHASNRVVWASAEAWRFIGWRWFDPDAGRVRLLPAETFGFLPGPGADAAK